MFGFKHWIEELVTFRCLKLMLRVQKCLQCARWVPTLADIGKLHCVSNSVYMEHLTCAFLFFYIYSISGCFEVLFVLQWPLRIFQI